MKETTIWILGDQLLANHPALLSMENAENATILMIESQQRTHKLPYQRKRLVLMFSAMRHYANELRQRGYAVDYVQANNFLEGLQQHVSRYHPDQFVTMAASSFRGRHFQQQLQNTLTCRSKLYPIPNFWSAGTILSQIPNRIKDM
jgi:deoxyribodipyrimidine photolyase-related protein